MTTATEMNIAIGKTRLLRADGLFVEVRILDARTVYGKTQYQVTPTTGSGVKWVDISSLKSEA